MRLISIGILNRRNYVLIPYIWLWLRIIKTWTLWACGTFISRTFLKIIVPISSGNLRIVMWNTLSQIIPRLVALTFYKFHCDSIAIDSRENLLFSYLFYILKSQERVLISFKMYAIFLLPVEKGTNYYLLWSLQFCPIIIS